MHRAMICVSVMLALFLVWPIVFGQRGESTASAATATPVVAKIVPAVAMVKVIPIPAKVSRPGIAPPKSCYSRYQASVQHCPKGDRACDIKIADQWDLCEATGFWPE